MSILEKLRDLVSALEETGEKEAPELEPEKLEPIESDQEISTEGDFEETLDYLECSEEESKIIYEKLLLVQNIKVLLGELVIETEEKKKDYTSQVLRLNRQVLEDLESLRLEYGIPEEGYSVQFPSSPESRVCFKKS